MEKPKDKKAVAVIAVGLVVITFCISMIVRSITQGDQTPGDAPKAAPTPAPIRSAPVPSPTPSSSGARFAPGQVTNFEQGLRMFQEGIKANRRVKLEPLDDAAALDAIRQAQRLIAASPEPRSSWKWDEVKRAVADVGGAVPLVKPPTGLVDQTTVMGYESYSGSMFAWPAALRGTDVAWVASLLVHEATHRVVTLEASRLSSFTPEELAALGYFCRDFDAEWKTMTEGLAFLNQGLWLARFRESKKPVHVPPVWSDMFQAVDALAQGKTVPFGEKVLNYAGNAHHGSEALYGNVHGMDCSPCPIIRGPRRGEPFQPFMVGAETILPIIESALHDH